MMKCCPQFGQATLTSSFIALSFPRPSVGRKETGLKSGLFPVSLPQARRNGPLRKHERKEARARGALLLARVVLEKFPTIRGKRRYAESRCCGGVVLGGGIALLVWFRGFGVLRQSGTTGGKVAETA